MPHRVAAVLAVMLLSPGAAAAWPAATTPSCAQSGPPGELGAVLLFPALAAIGWVVRRVRARTPDR